MISAALYNLVGFTGTVTEFTTEFKRSYKQQVLLGWGTLGALPVSAIGVGPAKTEQVPVSLILLPTVFRMENR